MDEDYKKLKEIVGSFIEFMHRGGKTFTLTGKGSPHQVTRLIEYIEELEELVK